MVRETERNTSGGIVSATIAGVTNRVCGGGKSI
jgi:hypothetical protein